MQTNWCIAMNEWPKFTFDTQWWITEDSGWHLLSTGRSLVKMKSLMMLSSAIRRAGRTCVPQDFQCQGLRLKPLTWGPRPRRQPRPLPSLEAAWLFRVVWKQGLWQTNSPLYVSQARLDEDIVFCFEYWDMVITLWFGTSPPWAVANHSLGTLFHLTNHSIVFSSGDCLAGD